ncbi:MAG TPA: Sbal_3080 family lipoprotein [Burkholderiales bacterium]|jgi:hypothetical protein|nr:Sbal_3080 family lipoprotein [Burkholderiales bacterium]
MKPILIVIALSLVLSGCVSTQVMKAASISDKTVCIIDNPAVRVDFRDAYERQVRAKGYETKIVNTNSACPTTSTYEASYGFHWGTYLATAQLTIYSNGKEIGKATYDAPYASPEKHGRVEGKIEALVAELLP